MGAKGNIITYKDESVSGAFTAIGISSHENDYRLTWNINEELGFSFVICAENIEIGEGKEFHCFVHEDDSQCLTLISNRCDKGFLVEKHRMLDYILKFDRELTEEETTAWLKKLRKLKLISAAFVLPIDSQIQKLLVSLV